MNPTYKPYVVTVTKTYKVEEISERDALIAGALLDRRAMSPYTVDVTAEEVKEVRE